MNGRRGRGRCGVRISVLVPGVLLAAGAGTGCSVLHLSTDHGTAASPSPTATVLATVTVTPTSSVALTPGPATVQGNDNGNGNGSGNGTGSHASEGAAGTGRDAGPAGPRPRPVRLDHEGTVYFASPTRNIGCFLLWYGAAHYVDCTVQQRDFADPPEPAGGCDLDWAPQFSLRDRATYGACRGDVDGMPTRTVLPYGSSAVDGPIVCDSEPTGLTCTNGRTGHGFRLSREQYQLF